VGAAEAAVLKEAKSEIDEPTTLDIAVGEFAEALVPDEVVTDLQFDRLNVAAGSSYSIKLCGSNLTSQTFFDVRFTSPGRNDPAVVLNWQRGLTASHKVAAGIASSR
jgi:hypothetical protein